VASWVFVTWFLTNLDIQKEHPTKAPRHLPSVTCLLRLIWHDTLHHLIKYALPFYFIRTLTAQLGRRRATRMLSRTRCPTGLQVSGDDQYGITGFNSALWPLQNEHLNKVWFIAAGIPITQRLCWQQQWPVCACVMWYDRGTLLTVLLSHLPTSGNSCRVLVNETISLDRVLPSSSTTHSW